MPLNKDYHQSHAQISTFSPNYNTAVNRNNASMMSATVKMPGLGLASQAASMFLTGGQFDPRSSMELMWNQQKEKFDKYQKKKLHKVQKVVDNE